MKIIKLQQNKAFTLIELMVATTIFSIIMLMGVGSLVVSSNSAKYARRLRIAVDNVNFAMESMTREIRMGTNYYCGDTVVLSINLGTSDCKIKHIIAFKPQDVLGAPDRVSYQATSKNGDGKYPYTLERCEFKSSTTTCVSITSSDVDLDILNFFVDGSALPPFNTVQPSVKILLKGVVNIGGTGTPFALQSIASQRSTEK